MNSTAPRPAAPALLNVHALRKHYGAATVVDGVSFRIAPGECLGVIGPNGAGKTTTIRMCLGLTAPDGGSIHYQTGGGAPALSMPRDALAIKAQLGVVTQFDTLDPDFSCAENLRVYARYFGLRGALVRERIPQLGVLYTSGYTGGKTANPSYAEVASHATGHAEAVRVVFDPNQVSYWQLLNHFWRSIDPIAKDRQFCDIGTPYRTAVFATTPTQLQMAKDSLAALVQSQRFAEPIQPQIVMLDDFYRAENEHQNYHQNLSLIHI